MAKCLRCGAGSEWIQGNVKDEPLSSHAVLADVLAIIDSLYGKRADDMYSQALDDIKEKLSEHFS